MQNNYGEGDGVLGDNDQLILSTGIILKGSAYDIEKLLKHIRKETNVRVIYQRTSSTRLYITAEENYGRD